MTLWLKRYLHKAATLGAVATLALIAGGCMGDDDDDSSSSGEGGGGGEPVTLTVWDFSYLSNQTAAVGNMKAAMQQIDQEFEKANPNITIKHVGIPFETLQTKLQASAASREGPDVVTLFPGTPASSFKRALLPLEDRLSEQQNEEIISVQDAYAADGHLYAIPHTLYGYIFEYNKKLVKQAGLDPEEPFKTWDDLLSACNTLHEKGIKPISGGWQDGFYPEWFIQVFQGQMLTPEERKQWSNWDIEYTKFKPTYENLIALRDANCWGDTGASQTQQDAHDNFVAGKAAMWLGLATEFDELKDSLGADNVGVQVFPPAPASKYPEYTDVGPLQAWGITNYSEHQDEAWEYISFIEKRESQELVWDVAGVIPNFKGLDVSSDYPPQDDALRAILDNPENHTAYMAYSQAIGAAQERALPQMLNDQISIDEALNQVNDAMQKDKPKIKGGS